MTTYEKYVTVAARALIAKWKHQHRPAIKGNIAHCHEQIALCKSDDVTESIRVMCARLADKTLSDGFHQYFRQEIKVAIWTKKLRAMTTDFYKDTIKALSYCYNEDIAKSEKYQAKMLATMGYTASMLPVGGFADCVSASKLRQDFIAYGELMVKLLDITADCVKIAKAVVDAAKPAREVDRSHKKHKKKMSGVLANLNEVGEAANEMFDDYCLEMRMDPEGVEPPICVDDEVMRLSPRRKKEGDKFIFNCDTVSSNMGRILNGQVFFY